MSDINIVLENRDDIHVAVEEKDINVEVPAGKDGRSLRPRGEWSASVAYAYLDLVSYEGSSYVATKAVPAGTLPTDTSYWMLSAEKGEPGTQEWGNIAGDLSDQTDLQNALDAKADVIISSASGSIASFSDGSPAPVTALSVGIEPVQDLHGYDNPWPAGGGKNLLSGIDFANNVQSNLPSATIDTTTKTVSFAYNAGGAYATVINGVTFKENTQYTFIFAVLNPSINRTNLLINYTDNTTTGFTMTKTNEKETISLTSTSGKTIRDICLQRQGGTTYLYYDECGIFEGANQPWSPFSNICPISGHTSAVVTRTGKNLFEPKFYDNVGYNWSIGTQLTPTETTGVIQSGNTYSKDVGSWQGIAMLSSKLPLGTYTLKAELTATNLRSSIYVLNDDMTISRNLGNQSSGTSRSINNTIILSGHESYIAFNNLCSGAGTVTISTPQLELGSTASAYEAPQIQTVTIDLDGTRYGGVLDVLTGEMTVTWTKVIFDGSNSGKVTYKYPNKYCFNITTDLPQGALVKTPNNNSTIGLISDMLTNLTDNVLYNGNYTGIATSTSGNFSKMGLAFLEPESVAAANAWLAEHPITVIAPLAEPQTVFLTPQQMNTLLGENHIWADTGDTTVEYRADTKLFIEGQIAQTAKVTRQMIADSATADGKAPKSLATGDLIIVGDELRKATANIGNGSAITASNSTIATLADVIKALQ